MPLSGALAAFNFQTLCQERSIATTRGDGIRQIYSMLSPTSTFASTAWNSTLCS